MIFRRTASFYSVYQGILYQSYGFLLPYNIVSTTLSRAPPIDISLQLNDTYNIFFKLIIFFSVTSINHITSSQSSHSCLHLDFGPGTGHLTSVTKKTARNLCINSHSSMLQVKQNVIACSRHRLHLKGFEIWNEKCWSRNAKLGCGCY